MERGRAVGIGVLASRAPTREIGRHSRHAALIGSALAEGALVVLIQITLERQTEEFLDRFESAIRRCPEVAACFLITGISGHLVRIEVADAATYEHLHRETLSRLPGVSRLQSNFTIRTVVGAKSLTRGRD
nr:Lrp/AsnC ligand binding domain-containing protein [Methylobacterium sp. J-070]